MNIENNGATPQGTEQEPSKNTEYEQSQISVLRKENSENYGEGIEKIPIIGTPFHIVKIDGDEEKTFIAVGDKRITEIQHETTCMALIEEKDWNIILALIIIITERVMLGIKLEDKARNELQTKLSFEEEAIERES